MDFYPNDGESVESEATHLEENALENQQETACPEEEPVIYVSDGCAEEADTAPEQKKSKKKKLPIIIAGLAGILVAAVAFVVVVVLAILLFFGLNKKDAPVLFIQDQELYVSDLSKIDPWQVTSDLADLDDNSDPNRAVLYYSYLFQYYTYLTENGKTLFYPDRLSDSDFYDGATIYFRDIQKPKKDATKLDSDIARYDVSENGKKVVYLKDDGSLYRHNLKEKEKISKDVKDYDVSDDCKRIIFITEDNILYRQIDNKDKEKIASDVKKFYTADNCKVVFFVTTDDILYRQAEGKDKERIASNIVQVVVYESGEVYFSTGEDKKIPMSDYIIDDMKDSDKALTEPESPSYPSPQAYESTAAYQQAKEDYYAAKEIYEEQYDIYREKLSRDSIRENMNEWTIDVQAYSIHYIDGNKTTTIVQDVLYDSYGLIRTSAVDKPAIIYTGCSGANAPKIKLSEESSSYNLADRIKTAFKETAAVYLASEDIISIIPTNKNPGNFCISADAKVMYYMDSFSEDNYYGDLYQVEISKNVAQKPELYDTDVHTSSLYLLEGDNICYFKDVDDDYGDLYFNKKCVDYEVYRSYVEYNADTKELLFFTDWDASEYCGTLKLYKNGKVKMVDDFVFSFSYTADNQLVYLKDYDYNKYLGTLYLYKSNKSQKIADDVITIVDYTYGSDS